ncbi:hypothetical protein O59_003656 [Cellvibrio sp. BR]|nr:hypothetical protein O59_003656 [Cellvibrio sp. BR]
MSGAPSMVDVVVFTSLCAQFLVMVPVSAVVDPRTSREKLRML